MASRVGFLVLVAALAGVGGARGAPPGDAAVYTVRVDPRLCPSPLCGGYWVAFANGARTRCQDGLRHPRCYVARAVDAAGSPIAIVDSALARGTIELGRDDLGELRALAVYAPAGSTPVTGGYYRVRDTSIRCVRGPCFSFTARQVNGSTYTRISAVDLEAANATPNELARARAALYTVDGLYARGRFAANAVGGRIFRASRIYLRAPLPRA